MAQKRGQERIVRSTLRAIWLLVPDPFSEPTAPGLKQATVIWSAATCRRFALAKLPEKESGDESPHSKGRLFRDYAAPRRDTAASTGGTELRSTIREVTCHRTSRSSSRLEFRCSASCRSSSFIVVDNGFGFAWSPEDFFVDANGVLFGFVEQFFVEFFTRSQTGEHDIDVVRISLAGKPNHVFGKIDDPNRFAHVQDQNVTAFTDGTGLQHQLHGFRDRHEISQHFGIGDGDRAAFFDLSAERRHDTASRIQHVPEANGDEPRF